jgi:hypothetical protein
MRNSNWLHFQIALFAVLFIATFAATFNIVTLRSMPSASSDVVLRLQVAPAHRSI